MANKGDDLLKTLNASFITELQRLVNKSKTGGNSLPDPDQYYSITVVNHEAVAKAKYTAVALGTPAITYTGVINHRHERLIYNTKALDVDDPDNWVVLLEPLPGVVGASAEALVVGITWLKTNDSVTEPRFIQVDDTEPVFKSSGKAYALFSYSDGTDYTTLIVMGSPSASTGNGLFLVGTGGIPVTNTSGAPPWTLGVASCQRLKVYDDAGTIKMDTTGNSESVHNMHNLLIPETCIISAKLIDGYWVAEGIIKQLRVDGLNWQLNLSDRSADTWNTWVTGEECPTSSGS